MINNNEELSFDDAVFMEVLEEADDTASFSEPLEEEFVKDSFKVKLNCSALNVRADHSKSSAVVTVLRNKDGLEVEISEVINDDDKEWGYSEKHGGWINLEFTSRI